MITAAVVFAEAVGVYDGRYVCQTQSYGPEARGGKSKAEVVISSIPTPIVSAAALLDAGIGLSIWSAVVSRSTFANT